MMAALAAAAIIALALTACSSTPDPTQVSGSIAATATVNPSVSKRPSPVLVRVYELKAANAFNGADFVSLYQRDQAELGADVVAREEMTLQPGEKRPYTKTLGPDTRFIAVFAAYRDLEHARWRAVVPVQVGKKQKLTIQADELSVSATVEKP
ncbi:type VI secretion system lipoprotein TssJ [Roseateles sp. SL47]|uniref:type VI secretion system lipoprotein TssJ n=1 Tax=Roseateles sp. SL47 TaxID=2995138 RepID=UPI00226F1790|nr:type VI secretion system lipoprotein TssJ [Roseateles sp. SL47]WAC71426.1 type VI secretion system lipoprotein TssJ [Roseateles sp. SL47]